MMRMNAMPMRAVTAVPTACILHSALTAGSTGAGIPIILSAAGLWLGGGECPRVLDPPTNSSASRASALRSPSPAGENAEPQAGACFRRKTSSRPRSRRASTTQVRGPCVFPHALLAPPPRQLPGIPIFPASNCFRSSRCFLFTLTYSLLSHRRVGRHCLLSSETSRTSRRRIAPRAPPDSWPQAADSVCVPSKIRFDSILRSLSRFRLA